MKMLDKLIRKARAMRASTNRRRSLRRRTWSYRKSLGSGLQRKRLPRRRPRNPLLRQLRARLRKSLPKNLLRSTRHFNRLARSMRKAVSFPQTLLKSWLS